MKKVIFLFLSLLLFNCAKEDELTYHELVQLAMANKPEVDPCFGQLKCLGYYEVELWFNLEGVPKEAIIAHDGFKADLGKIMTFEATDVPGWRFVGFRKNA